MSYANYSGIKLPSDHELVEPSSIQFRMPEPSARRSSYFSLRERIFSAPEEVSSFKGKTEDPANGAVILVDRFGPWIAANAYPDVRL
ncbi:MAG: hypothetical protein AAFP13_14995 [Pseudomonadota bacterium]